MSAAAATTDRAVLHALFEAALAASRPAGKFTGRLPPRPRGRTIVLGAGKAAASMAAAFEEAYDLPCEGLVVTRYGHGAPTRHVEVALAAHPVPDAAGRAAAERIYALAKGAGADDLVVFLISGGASALLTLPAAGVTLAEKQAITRALLASGAPIGAMNRIRKALSAIKGGRLAEAIAPAGLITYAISDIPGDDVSLIGSGPTIGVPPPPQEVFAILADYRIEVPPSVARAIEANAARAVAPAEGPVHLLAAPMAALEAAAARARSLGFAPLILGDAIEGEAREVGRVMAGVAQSVRRHGQPVRPPAVLLSGGETTVTVRGKGRGGRNAEFLLALRLALAGEDGVPGIAAIACDTDGIDGSEDNAGAWFGDETGVAGHGAVADRRAMATSLAGNDAYGYFAAAGRLVMTGPTLTNVNDFRAVLVR